MDDVKRFRFVDRNGYPALQVADQVTAERFVEEHYYDAQRLRADTAEAELTKLREKLSYEESDHHTTSICRDAWRNKYEELLDLLSRAQSFVAFVHKCCRKNKEYAPLHWQEMRELDRDLSASATTATINQQGEE